MNRRLVLQHSLSFLLEWMGASIRTLPDVHQTDLLILLALWGANRRHLHEDLETLRQVCFEERATPPALLRGASRGSIARFLNLPLETGRRRIEVLIESGRVRERTDGLICTAFTRDPGVHGAHAKRHNADQVALLYNRLLDAGFRLPVAKWIFRPGGQKIDRVHPGWICPVTRLSVEYALLMVSEAMHAFDISFPHLLILFTIHRHNIDHLADRKDVASADVVIADKMRRGISYAAATRMVSMPWTTVRRRILDLLSKGLVDRTSGGVIVPARVERRFLYDTHLDLHNNKYLTQMFTNLDALGEGV